MSHEFSHDFNYSTYNSNLTSGTMVRPSSEDHDYFTEKINSYMEFDMRSLYVDQPTEKVQILQEIYNTERTYVKALTVVDEVFIHQLHIWCPKLRKCFRSIFGEISAICKTHQILLESLRSKPIAEVFTKFVPFLKLYTSYASHYPNALKMFAKLMSRNDFRKVLAKIEEDTKVEGKTLQSYLIMPIQRIPRYIMLIQNLMNYSTEKDDMTNLYKALFGMQALSEQIQSCMTAYENGERLLAIQLDFGLDGHILEPGRILLREGMLYKRELNGLANYQETVVFLFNDIILYGVKRISVISLCKYEPSAILSLRHCVVKLDEIGGSIFIRCGDVGVDFTAYSLGEITEWYNEICDAIENAKKLRDTLRKESFKQKSIVFDRGFWQRNRNRLRNILNPEITSNIGRVLSRRKSLPKLEESDFLRGQWTTSSTESNQRKRKITTLDGEEGETICGWMTPPTTSERKRKLYVMDESSARKGPGWLTKKTTPSRKRKVVTMYDECPEDIKNKRQLQNVQLENATFIQQCTDLNSFPSTPKSKIQTYEDDDSYEDFIRTDDEKYTPDGENNPMRRATSFDEEDRRPRNVGGVRRTVASEPPRRNLAVEDIRKLSYQERSIEPLSISTEDIAEDEIETKVKGERPRPWWESESAPLAIKYQKTSFLDSIKNNCTIM